MKKIFSVILCVVLVFSLTACDTKIGFGFSGDSSKKMTEEEALKIAKEFISRYETYNNIGIACDLDSGENITKSENEAAWKLLSDDQKTYLSCAHKCMCCKTYEQAIKHTTSCISDSLLKFTTKDYVIYNNNLYFFMANQGSTTYKDVKVTKFNQNEINARANLYNSGDQICDAYHFVIKKTKSGEYQLCDVKKVDYEVENQTENDKPSVQNKWSKHYRKLLLNFSESEYAEFYSDQTIPVLFDVDNDKTPELFVFCAVGANMMTEKCIMFQIKNDKLNAYYCNDLGHGSGSYNNMRLYKDKNGKKFILLSDFDIGQKDGIKDFGNSIVKLTFDGEKIATQKIASNYGTVAMGEEDIFSFENKTFSNFDNYYFAISNYVASLREIKTKNSLKNKEAGVFPVALYGISENDVNNLFNAFVNS